jgi:hypothetical protein
MKIRLQMRRGRHASARASTHYGKRNDDSTLEPNGLSGAGNALVL